MLSLPSTLQFRIVARDCVVGIAHTRHRQTAGMRNASLVVRAFATTKRNKIQKSKGSSESTRAENKKKKALPQQQQQQQQPVPPAHLMPTASPFVYVASCAIQEFGINHKSLFADIASTTELPPTFRSSSFEFFNPKSFQDQTWDIPEVAFLGRSNVGKSSLVNALMRNNLAKCSKHPGRTQQVNYFALFEQTKKSTRRTPEKHPSDATGFLVDLPGYGYAKAPDDNVDAWQKNTQDFLLNCRDANTMKNVFVLVDARRGPTQTDRNVMGWLDEADISYTIVLTKADKVSRPQLIRFVNEVCMRYHSQFYGQQQQGGGGSQAPMVHITSSTRGEGIRELLSTIETDFLTVSDE